MTMITINSINVKPFVVPQHIAHLLIFLPLLQFLQGKIRPPYHHVAVAAAMLP